VRNVRLHKLTRLRERTGVLINPVEGGISETLLIVSLRHRIYIDCFCVRVTFQNQYSCMAAFQNQFLLFLIDCFCVRERDEDGCIG